MYIEDASEICISSLCTKCVIPLHTHCCTSHYLLTAQSLWNHAHVREAHEQQLASDAFGQFTHVWILTRFLVTFILHGSVLHTQLFTHQHVVSLLIDDTGKSNSWSDLGFSFWNITAVWLTSPKLWEKGFLDSSINTITRSSSLETVVTEDVLKGPRINSFHIIPPIWHTGIFAADLSSLVKAHACTVWSTFRRPHSSFL